jgi:hypothetical protein
LYDKSIDGENNTLIYGEMSDSSSPSQQLPNSEDEDVLGLLRWNEERRSGVLKKDVSEMTSAELRSLIDWGVQPASNKEPRSVVFKKPPSEMTLAQLQSLVYFVLATKVDSNRNIVTLKKVEKDGYYVAEARQEASIRARPAGPDTDEVSALSQSLSQLGVGTDEAQKQ